MNLLEPIRDIVRSVVRRLARFLNRASGGRLTPNQVTFAGLAVHIPVAWLIGTGHTLWAAAIFLIIFGLADTLDGELARVENRSSLVGMFIDSATDRMKEIILYCGIMAALVRTGHHLIIIATIGALGVSLLTSYLNAWGEVVLSQSKQTADHKVNKSFRSGLLSFDLRMVLIIFGLLINRLEMTVYVILALATLTVFQRFVNITGRLRNVQD